MIRSRPLLRWIDDSEFAIDETRFRLALLERFRSTPDRFLLLKPKWMVERYLELVAELEPENVFELGIFQGGSTAFLARICEPRKLVAVELRPRRNAALDSYLERHGLGDRVVAHYGIDQADRAELARVAEAEFAGAPLDLVIDDASHLVAQTRASFNALFPRLRPGGRYVIEDWTWGLSTSVLYPDGYRPESQPLAAFIFELVLACGSAPKLVEEISVGFGWACLRRGPAELDPASFDVAETYLDRARELLPDPDAGRSAEDG